VVTSVVGLVVLLFVAAALVFAWAVAARTPSANDPLPSVPHPVAAQSAACGRCHSVADGTAPPTHRRFADDSCTACHAVGPATRVPHTVAMGDTRCVLCHGDPALELGMPADHLTMPEKECTFCHEEDARRAGVQPAPAGVSVLPAPDIDHPVSGAFATCLHCHRVGSEPLLPASHEAFGADTCRFLCHLRG
jgi:hypothetical protein